MARKKQQTIGEFVKERRKEKKLTRREIQAATGLTEHTIYNFETGRKSTRPDTMTKILASLRCRIITIIRTDEGTDHEVTF